jgi:cyclohexanecarboxyl-CoA dehydrogenase
MDFDFDETERTFQDVVRRYARERLLPDYQRWDSGERFPRERVAELGSLGLMGLRVPVEYGGSAGSYVLAGIASEELARGDHSVTLIIQLAAIAADLIGGHGSDRLKRELLPQLAAGDRMIAFGLTEPGAGSDAAALRTIAKREEDCWVIDGEKASISLAGTADDCVVFARMSGGGARGIGAVVVPLDAPGVSRRPYHSVGGRLSERGALIFDQVRVPLDNQLGAEGSGFVQAMEAFDYNRALIALACIGAANQSIEETIAYAKQRETFGKPLARHEAYAFQIAEHATQLEAARLMAYRTLWLRDQGRPHTREAAMVKWLGPKVAAEACHAAITLHGWLGYDESLPLGQRLRDVIGLEIGDGTPEIMKGIVAREIFGREYTAYR